MFQNCFLLWQAKELLSSLAATKEGITLKHRIEECEHAAALANGGCLVISRRDLQLNVRKMIAGKYTLPWKLELQLCVRHADHLFDQLPAHPTLCDSKTEGVQDLLNSFSVWRAFVPDEVSQTTFDPANGSFTSLALKFQDYLALPELAHVEEPVEAEDLWQALGFWVPNIVLCVGFKCFQKRFNFVFLDHWGSWQNK